VDTSAWGVRVGKGPRRLCAGGVGGGGWGGGGGCGDDRTDHSKNTLTSQGVRTSEPWSAVKGRQTLWSTYGGGLGQLSEPRPTGKLIIVNFPNTGVEIGSWQIYSCSRGGLPSKDN